MGKNKSKLLLLIFPIVILTIGAFFLFNGQEIEKVQAGVGDNVFGWAWSENIGWISFNSTNCDADGDGFSDGVPSGCPPAETLMTSYGVHIDEGTSIFSGYAWSENIGWISFNKSELSGCFSGDCWTEVDLSSHEVSGWARALAPKDDPVGAGGWDGWIRLRGPNYGVKINNITQEFEGWAWGGDDSDSTAVIGWISFNHLNCDSNGDGVSDQGKYSQCPIGQSVADYKVKISFFLNNPPTATDLTVTPLDYCINSLPTKLSWSFSDLLDPGDTQGAYQVQVDDNSDFSSLEIDSGKVYSSSEAYTASGLSYKTTYYWRLKVWDNGDAQSDWIYPDFPFPTPLHTYPDPDFNWFPSPPSVDEITQFCATKETGICLEDVSTCYDINNNSISCSGEIFLWTFPAGTEFATGTSATSENPRVKFDSTVLKVVFLQITDDLGTCSTDWTVNVTFPLPEWQEVAP